MKVSAGFDRLVASMLPVIVLCSGTSGSSSIRKSKTAAQSMRQREACELPPASISGMCLWCHNTIKCHQVRARHIWRRRHTEPFPTPHALRHAPMIIPALSSSHWVILACPCTTQPSALAISTITTLTIAPNASISSSTVPPCTLSLKLALLPT